MRNSEVWLDVRYQLWFWISGFDSLLPTELAARSQLHNVALVSSLANQIQPDQAETFYMCLYISVVYIIYVFLDGGLANCECPPTPRGRAFHLFIYHNKMSPSSHTHLICAFSSHTVCIDMKHA